MRISDLSSDVCSSDLLDAAIPSDEWRSIQPDLDVARLEIRTDTEFDIRNLFRSERLELSQAAGKRRSVYAAGAIAAPRDDIEEQIAIGLPVEPDCPGDRKHVGTGKSVAGRVEL